MKSAFHFFFPRAQKKLITAQKKLITAQKKMATKKKKRKNTNDDTNDEDETKKTKKRRKNTLAITDAGELLVKMHAHGSFVRPLFVHRQTQKDIRERREALSAEFEEEEREEEEGEAAAAAAAAATAAATVLVTGFPLEWHNEFSVSDLFSSSFGETKRVQLIRLETNAAAKSALVTFERTKSVEKLWKKIEEKTIVEAPTILPRGSTKNDNNSGKLNAPPQFGLDKFVYEHRLQRKGGAKAAKASIDEWFRDRAKAKEIEKRKRERENEDDGWTVVQQKRGRRKTSDNQGITVGAVRASTAERRRKEALRLEENDGDDDDGGFPDAGENNGSSFYRKKKKGTLGLAPVENFYKFQSRERRRNDLIALQRGFQADKAKVLAMKAARKFKPV
jgi:ribosomal RNA-processing protein 7